MRKVLENLPVVLECIATGTKPVPLYIWQHCNYLKNDMVYCAIFYTNRPSKLHVALQCVESNSNILFFISLSRYLMHTFKTSKREQQQQQKKIQYNVPFLIREFSVYFLYIFFKLLLLFFSLQLNVQCLHFSRILFPLYFLTTLNFSIYGIISLKI